MTEQEFKKAQQLLNELTTRAQKSGRFKKDMKLFHLSQLLAFHTDTKYDLTVLPEERDKFIALIGAVLELGYHLRDVEREESVN